MYLAIREQGEKPTSDFLKSGVPAIVASIILVGSLLACVIIRKKAKRKQEMEDKAAGYGRESLDLELDAVDMSRLNGRNGERVGLSFGPDHGGHRRQSSRPKIHSRSTSVSLSYVGTDDGSTRFGGEPGMEKVQKDGNSFPARGSSRPQGNVPSQELRGSPLKDGEVVDKL